MGKAIHDDVLDGAWDVIKINCSTQLICAGQPTDRADALNKALAEVAMSSDDFVLSDGDISGRKLVVAAKTNITVDASGTADHVALIDDTRLLYVTTVTSKTLVEGGIFDTPSWRAEIKDPV